MLATMRAENQETRDDDGRYRLIRLIKRGGMAEVFEARRVADNGFERRVALRRPLPHTPEDAFVDESRILGQLDHPGIISIFDVGTAGGLPFQILEYIDGMNLCELVAHGLPEWERREAIALYITAQIAAALHFAHEAVDANGRPLSIVHRDVTPQNILVSYRGETKLIDFGIALTATRREDTMTGIVKGKPTYMAPEQLFAQPLSPKTDVYQLGCVLAYLLLGDRHFRAEMPLMRAGSPSMFSSVPAADTQAIIRRALATSPMRRYPTARNFGETCEAVLSARGVRRPQAALVEWLSEVKATPAKKVYRPPIAELFDVDSDLDLPLVTPAATSTPARRSSSRQPSAASVRLVTALSPAEDPDADPAGVTKVPTVELLVVEPVRPATVDQRPPTELVELIENIHPLEATSRDSDPPMDFTSALPDTTFILRRPPRFTLTKR